MTGSRPQEFSAIQLIKGRSAALNETIDTEIVDRLSLEYSNEAANWGEFVYPLMDGHGTLYTRSIIIDINGNPIAIEGGPLNIDSVSEDQNGENIRSFLYGFDGSSFDRIRTVSLNNNEEPDGILAVTQPIGSFATDTPALNTAPSITIASPGPDRARVATHLHAVIAGPDASGILFVRIRSGAGGTIVWEQAINKSATEGMAELRAAPDLFAFINNNTALVAEFSGTPGANNQATLSLGNIVVDDT